MSQECPYKGDGCCLCSACQSMRKTLEEVEKMPKEEIEKMFEEAEQMMLEVEQWKN